MQVYTHTHMIEQQKRQDGIAISIENVSHTVNTHLLEIQLQLLKTHKLTHDTAYK